MSFKFPGFKRVCQELEVGRELFLSIVAINAYTSTRVFAVGLMTNNTLTGFYSIAERISNVAQTFPLSSFSQAIFPRLSNIYRRCRRPRKKVHSWPWWSRGGEFFQNGLSRSFLDPFPLIVFHSFFPS